MSESRSTVDTRTVLEVLQLATEYLKGKECESARLGAEVLLAEVLGCDRLGIYLRFEQRMYEEQLARYREMIRRRSLGEPVAYILGRKEFHSLDFEVNFATLIPRPDTETLVDAVVTEIRQRRIGGPKVLDLGTGSGTILLAIASELKEGLYVGTDASSEALEVAQRNARRLVPEAEVRFYFGDWWEALNRVDSAFDVIVSNPPYITSGSLESLPPEISRYEPRKALDGGEDGLKDYRMIAPRLLDWLVPGGFAAFEIGEEQGSRVSEMFRFQGFEVEVLKDAGGQDRVVMVRTPL